MSHIGVVPKELSILVYLAWGPDFFCGHKSDKPPTWLQSVKLDGNKLETGRFALRVSML